MRTFRDQMGIEVMIPDTPRRVISLVPSQTEYLFDIGAGDQVCGVTRFCIHPAEAKTKTIVGGTKKFDIEVIRALQPDLIIGNKEENYQEGINALKALAPVWMSDIACINDAYLMMQTLGEIMDRRMKAAAIIDEIRSGMRVSLQRSPFRVLYLIWRKPWMAAGSDTFIDAMLRHWGFANAINAVRYPQLSDMDISTLNPDLIFLSSEPYPFGDKHMAEAAALAPHARVVRVDGEMFSWYGSRLRLAGQYMKKLMVQLS